MKLDRTINASALIQFLILLLGGMYYLGTMDANMKSLDTDMQRLDSDMKTLDTDMQSLEGTVGGLETKIDHLEKEFLKHE